MDSDKSFLQSRNWLNSAFLLGVVTGLFLLIWWLAEKELRQEQVFLEVCWEQGQAHYPDTDEQKRACGVPVSDLRWVKRTKTVRWEFPKSFDVYLESHRLAISWINSELGFEALREGTNVDGGSDIIIRQGDYGAGWGAMSTTHFRTGDKIFATITVRAPQNIRAWMLEEQHELLHALGLAHDRRGIMSKSLDEPNGDLRVWLLHTKDRDALRVLLDER